MKPRERVFRRFVGLVKFLRAHGAEPDYVARAVVGLAYVSSVMDYESDHVAERIAARVDRLLPKLMAEIESRIQEGKDDPDEQESD